MTKIIVSGCCGRMGKAICRLAIADRSIKLVGALEMPKSECIGKDIGQAAGLGSAGVCVTDKLSYVIRKADVVIDFTSPLVTIQNLDAAILAGKAMVIGTTGFSQKELKRIGDASKKIPVLISPNMSLGVNLMFKLVAETAKALPDDYDIEIVETHHNQKKDAPSGTALRIGEVIANSKGRNLKDLAVYGRKGMAGARPKGQIAIHSVRAADIVGEHLVLFAGSGESIELTHRARSRDTFAKGAILAAKFLCGKKHGLYSMADVLKIN